ncbi:MAG: hypothetical protein AAGC60_08160 [Acidobacteriota bacterium]
MSPCSRSVLLALILAVPLGLLAAAGAPLSAAVEAVEETTVAEGDLLTLLGSDLPLPGAGIVFLTEDAGLGTVCHIESSDGALLQCRVGAVGEGFVGRVRAVHGRWYDLGGYKVEGQLGTWAVDASWFLAEVCPEGDEDHARPEVVVTEGSGVSARNLAPWMPVELPGDQTIGIDHVVQPGHGGCGGGSQREATHSRRLKLVGSNLAADPSRPNASSTIDPDRLALDVAQALRPSYAPFAIKTSSQGPELWLEVPQATAADFLVVSGAPEPAD